MAIDSKEVRTMEVPEEETTKPEVEERSSRVTPKWFKHITRSGDMYERSTDVTEDIRKEDGESDVTKSIRDKYNEQSAPQKKTQKATPVSRYKETKGNNGKTVYVPKTDEDVANEKDEALQKSKARTNNYVGRVSKSGRVYYAAATGGNAEWRAMRRRQAAAYNRARANAK